MLIFSISLIIADPFPFSRFNVAFLFVLGYISKLLLGMKRESFQRRIFKMNKRKRFLVTNRGNSPRME